MNTAQIQLKISLSEQLNALLASRAALVGVPVTQLVKHLILKEVAYIEYPSFQQSLSSEKKTKEALEQRNQAVDASDFFKKLHEG